MCKGTVTVAASKSSEVQGTTALILHDRQLSSKLGTWTQLAIVPRYLRFFLSSSWPFCRSGHQTHCAAAFRFHPIKKCAGGTQRPNGIGGPREHAPRCPMQLNLPEQINISHCVDLLLRLLSGRVGRWGTRWKGRAWSVHCVGWWAVDTGLPRPPGPQARPHGRRPLTMLATLPACLACCVRYLLM